MIYCCWYGAAADLPRGGNSEPLFLLLAMDITSDPMSTCDKARSCRIELDQWIRMARARKTTYLAFCF
jgi:hypothetical protein